MKKRLNTEAIRSELEGSVFFPQPQRDFFPQPQKEPQIQEKKPEDTTKPRHQDTMIPSNRDTTTPQNKEDILETVRKSVRRIGKEAATLRCTLEERQALDEIEYQYKRQGIRTSGNEITRISVNYIVEEYRMNGESSVLAQVLKKL